MASTHLKAVLEIANASPQLRNDLLPVIDQEKEDIHWGRLGSGLSGGVLTAVAWAKAIWSGEVDKDGRDLFEGFGSLDVQVQRAILRAITVRYGI